MRKRNNSEQERKIKWKQEVGGEARTRSRVMCVQSLTILHDDSQGEMLSLDKLQDTLQEPVLMRQAHIMSCHNIRTEVQNGCDLSLKQLLKMWQNTFSQLFSSHPSRTVSFFPPTPQANPTSQTQHSPIKHVCVWLCVWECPPPSVSPWLDCGSSSAPYGRVVLWLSSTLFFFSLYPQVPFLGIPKPAHPRQR